MTGRFALTLLACLAALAVPLAFGSFAQYLVLNVLLLALLSVSFNLLFGMTGLLRWASDGGERHPHDRVFFVCEGGELRYNNMRRFGGVWLADGSEERSRVTGPLGPDAAGLSFDEFERLLAVPPTLPSRLGQIASANGPRRRRGWILWQVNRGQFAVPGRLDRGRSRCIRCRTARRFS